MRAKKIVQAQIRAKGQMIADFEAREIRLRAEAAHTIATLPGFARWRRAELTTDAQKQSEPKSTTSTGAK